MISLRHTGNKIASGGRDGALYLWDLSKGHLIRRFRAHKGQLPVISVLQSTSEEVEGCVGADDIGIFCTGGTDGLVKLWDSRQRGSVASRSCHSPAAVGVLEPVSSASTGFPSLLLSGGSDNKVHLLDTRRNLEPIASYECAQNCVYSTLSIGAVTSSSSSDSLGMGRGCVMVGDGRGMVCCYDLSNGELKYGFGASSKGAVRALVLAREKVVACGEDGKVSVYTHTLGSI